MDRRDFLRTAGRATIALGSVPLWPAIASSLPGDAGADLEERVVSDLAGTWRFRLNPSEMGREFGAWFNTRLPAEIAHADAAYSVGRATLLGAALASGSADLFAAAADDRLHEPYRAAKAPLLAAVRSEPPDGALGATISGSGPTVIVWVQPEHVTSCAAELRSRFPGVEVLPLQVAGSGAGEV